jgi:hypothetical protein
MTCVDWRRQLFASLALAAPSRLGGYRRRGIALLFNARSAGAALAIGGLEVLGDRFIPGRSNPYAESRALAEEA